MPPSIGSTYDRAVGRLSAGDRFVSRARRLWSGDFGDFGDFGGGFGDFAGDFGDVDSRISTRVVRGPDSGVETSIVDE